MMMMALGKLLGSSKLGYLSVSSQNMMNFKILILGVTAYKVSQK